MPQIRADSHVIPEKTVLCSVEWLVLCDGKKLQIYQYDTHGLHALFQEPQPSESMAWLLPQELRRTPMSFARQIGAFLTKHSLAGTFHQMILVAPEPVANTIKAHLPDHTHRKLVRCIYRDLTYCPKAALRAYFTATA